MKKVVFLFFMLMAVMLSSSGWAQVGGKVKVVVPQREERGIPAVITLSRVKDTNKKNDFKSVAPFRVAVNSASVPAFRSAGDGTVLYGTAISASGWGATDARLGIYSFPAVSNTKCQLVAADSKFKSNAAVYAKGKYYMFGHETNILGWLSNVWCRIYDASTWTLTSEPNKEMVYTNVVASSAITYDASSGKVYAVTGNQNGEGFCLSTMNLENGDFTVVADISRKVLTLSASAAGTLYAIAEDGGLYTVDKTTADMSLVGMTGVIPQYSQSAIIDYHTGKMYWASMNENNSVLYEVNTANGMLYKISDMPNMEEMIGLFIKEPVVDGEAPASVVDLTFEPSTPGGLKGKVTCMAPSRTYSGGSLTGNVSVVIKVGGKEILRKEVQAGAAVEQEYQFNANEMHSINACASNESGVGPKTSITVFIGKDVPPAVHTPKLVVSPDGAATLTWNAPSQGVHGGYLDKTSLSYKIVRYPDQVVVQESLEGTTFTETLPSRLAVYSYEITTCWEAVTGGKTFSNEVAYGWAYDVPFSESFDNSTMFGFYKVFDVNNDGSTWKHNPNEGIVSYLYNAANSANDWLISPAINLDEENSYSLSFKLSTGGSSENVKVTLGTSPDPSTHHQILADFPELCEDIKEHRASFSVPKTGKYYLGFYAYSEADKHVIKLHEMSLEKGLSVNLPDSVTKLKLLPDPKGALKATLTFSAPAVSYSGKPLEGSVQIAIIRNETKVKSISCQPGEAYSWEDVSPVQGMNTYSIVSSNEKGTGASVKISAFIGWDIPDTVRNLTIKSQGNRKAILAWEAPLKGVNGGYMDASQLTYTVYRSEDNQNYTPLSAGTNISALNFTDETAEIFENSQVLYSYAVVANAVSGASQANTNYIILGTPYLLPFSESFTYKTLSMEPWVMSSVTGSFGWSMINDSKEEDMFPQDNDHGLLMFKNTWSEPVVDSRLKTPMIDMGQIAKPVFTFWMYHWSSVTDPTYLAIEASVDDGEFEQVGDIVRVNAGDGWIEHRISLDAYKGKKRVQFALRGYTAETYMYFFMDNIHIEDYLDYDLAMESLTGPAEGTMNSPVIYNATVINRGAKAASGYSVHLYRNGKLMASKTGEDVAPDSSCNVEFSFMLTAAEAGNNYEYSAEVMYDNDLRDGNNKSNTVDLKVNGSWYPTASSLTAEVNQLDVTLRWAAPVLPEEPLATEDGVESYESFIVNNIGEWLVFDGDGLPACSTSELDDVYYANKLSPQSFQVWCPSEIGFKNSLWQPRTGTKCFICWAATGSRTPQNNDWLISPELAAGSTFSFYVAKPVGEFTEDFEVLTSSTDQNPESFVLLKAETVPSIEWSQFTYTLPAGAKYIAIRYVAADHFALFLDDISYTSAFYDLSVKGYNIFRNGEKLNESLVQRQDYADLKVPAGEHEYGVSVVFNRGESVLSEPLRIAVGSGIDSEYSGAQVYTEGKNIIVVSTEKKSLVVSTIDGRIISNCMMEETNKVIPVSDGIYLVKVGSSVTKVLVK